MAQRDEDARERDCDRAQHGTSTLVAFDRRHAQIDFRPRVRFEHNRRLRVREPDDHVRELEVRDGALGIPKIERLAYRFRLFGAAQHAVDEVVDEAPGADLRAVVVERNRLLLQRLRPKRRPPRLPRSLRLQNIGRGQARVAKILPAQRHRAAEEPRRKKLSFSVTLCLCGEKVSR